MTKVFLGNEEVVTAPGIDAFAITKSDATVFTSVTRALYIGTSGDVAVKMKGGTTLTFVAVPVGILPIRAEQVLSTGTTAANIIGLV